MNDLSRNVNWALDQVPAGTAVDQAREALAGYHPPDPIGALILLNALEPAVGESEAMVALDMHPPAPGLVYCCPSEGWVTPSERDAHRYDSSSGWGDD